MVKDIKLILESSDHCPGAIVHGRLMVSVDKPKKYNNIVVKLWGGAEVHWTETRGRLENRRTVHYRNAVTYIDVQAIVWEPEDSPTRDLPAGEHCFPFSFQLPVNTLSSFEGACGQVRYKVEARVLQSGVINSILKSKHVVKADLAVKGGTPTDSLGVYNEPKAVDDSRRLNFLCFKFGSISARVSVPRTGFSPGETIPVTVSVSNQSSRELRVASALHRGDTFTAKGGKRKLVISPISRAAISIVRPGMVTSYEETSLTIPTNVQVTMRNCSIISVEYILAAKVFIPRCSNVVLKIPVVIANSDSTSETGPVAPFSLPLSNLQAVLLSLHTILISPHNLTIQLSLHSIPSPHNMSKLQAIILSHRTIQWRH